MRASIKYVLTTARQKATQALGTNVAVGDYTLRFNGISPTLDIYNVSVAGAAPYADPPLLQVDHARVGVKIISLLSKKWYLNDVELHHPVVHVFVDAHGNSNLPQTRSSGGGSRTNIFDLGVRHAVLDNGEIYYNNKKSVMDADLHQLALTAGFDPAQKRYSGTLSYRDGSLKMDKMNPVPHDLDAKFDLTPDRFTLENATLRSGQSQFSLSATVDDYSSTHLRADAKYTAALDTGEFRQILKDPTLPVGTIHLAGALQYQAQPDVPALKLVHLNGTLTSNDLELRTPTMRASMRDLAATYQVANNNADVRDLRANLLGGRLNGALTVTDLTGASRSHLVATLHGAQLADAKALAGSPALKQVDLRGTLDANADATWGKTFANVIAKADSTIHGSLAPAQPRSTNAAANAAARTPLEGVIHARYNGATSELALSKSYIRLPQTSLDMNGTVGDHSALQVNLRANDLHELETLAGAFQGSVPAPSPSLLKVSSGQTTSAQDRTTAPVAPLGLYGTATFNGMVRGATTAPEISGRLIASNVKVRGTDWRSLRADIAAGPSAVSIKNAELDPGKRGRITLNARAGLRQWSFTPNSPIQLSANASQIEVADLARAAGSATPVSGTLAANIQLSGSQLNPVGHGDIDLTSAVVSGEPIQSAHVRFNGTGETVNANSDVHLAAGVANAQLTYHPRQKTYTAKLNANGIRLERLHAVQARNLQINGAMDLDAQGQGSVEDPGLSATLRIPNLKVQGQNISGIALQANVADHIGRFLLDSNAIDTKIHGQGTVNLTGDYYTQATLDTQRIPLQPLVALYAPSQAANISGQTELHATLRGPAKNTKLLEAHATIPYLAVTYRNAAAPAAQNGSGARNSVELAAAAPIHADYVNGVLDLQRTAIRGTDTDLQLQASVPMTSNAPMSLLALGAVDLRIAQLFNPDIATSGQLRFNINSFGSRRDPNVQGSIDIVNAAVNTGSTPVGLENGNGTLTLTRDRVNVTRFTGTVGGGTVSASGGVVYRPAIGFDLALSGEGVRMLMPPGVRAGMGANLALSGDMNNAVLRGQVDLDQLSFTPDFDLSALMGSFGGTSSVPPAQGFSNNLQLELSVVSPNGINLVSRDLSLQANTSMRVRGTAAEPVLLGRVNLEGGDLLFRGNRYLLQGGTIDFVNPVRTDPLLNVTLDTTIQQYDIAMHFEGPVERMRTSYTADPALPPSDIINLLAFGKTSEAAAANPNPPGNLGAQSAIASAVSGQVTDRVEKIAGISHLSVDPTLGGNQQTPGATVTIQQRVTGKIFVTFSTDVTGTQRDVIQLEYKRSPRMSFSATRDQNGGFAVDTKFQKSW